MPQEPIEVRLARIEEALNSLIIRMDERCLTRHTMITDLERKVSCLERAKAQVVGGWWTLTTVAAVCMALGAILSQFTAALLKGGL